MVEDSNNPKPYETKQIDLCDDQPEEHVEIVKEIGPLNGLDLKKYFTGYAIDMCSDSINCFYGGTALFDGKYNPYDKEKSAGYKDLVEKRLKWMSDFEYTPKEIKEKAKEFLEDFIEIKDTLDSAESWTEINNEWLTIKSGLVKDAYDKHKEAMSHFNSTGRAFVNKSTKEGLKVKEDLS